MVYKRRSTGLSAGWVLDPLPLGRNTQAMWLRILAIAVLVTGLVGPASAQIELFRDDPVIVAAYENRPSDVRNLMVRRASTTRSDGDGKTALIWGAIQGSYDAIEVLLEFQVRTDIVDGLGNSALYYAAGNGHFDVVELLLEVDKLIDRENLEGRTPLMNAAGKSQAEVAKLLIERGADINHTDFTGRSVLDMARNGRSRQLVKILEAAGAR
jgi:ankyrin repeat protein